MQSAELVYSDFGDDQDLKVMVTEFIDHLPVRVDQLRACGEARDLDALRREAHRMKGAGGCYGFSELAESAGVVEDACCEGLPEYEISAALDDLLELCSRLRPGRPK